MSDISLLPEGLRGKEQSAQQHKPTPAQEPSGLKMHVPDSAADEDIEIIEVDESDLGTILADEPLFTRLSYQLSAALDHLKETVFSKAGVPPPKLPPQFFTPPKQGLVSRSGALTQPVAGGASRAGGATPPPAGTAYPRARITPQADTPRRVRVIRRVRKPVRISLLSAEEMELIHIDVPKRQWTMGVCIVLFSAIIASGYWLLSSRVAEAEGALAVITQDLTLTRVSITGRENIWSQYRDLQRRLTLLDEILNRHTLVSRVFDFLEKQTLPEVSYLSADISIDGAIALDVVADSYESAAKQLVAYHQSPIVEEAESMAFGGGISADGSPARVSFALALKLNENALRGPLSDTVAPTSTPASP